MLLTETTIDTRMNKPRQSVILYNIIIDASIMQFVVIIF